MAVSLAVNAQRCLTSFRGAVEVGAAYLCFVLKLMILFVFLWVFVIFFDFHQQIFLQRLNNVELTPYSRAEELLARSVGRTYFDQNAERTVSDKQQSTPETEEQQAAEDSGAEDVVVEEQQSEEAEQLSPEAQIEALQDELTKTKDDALRTLAEAQNIRRRSEKDVENARKFALEKFAGELLGVADNLERALDTADRDNEVIKPLAEGVELTQKSLVDILAKFNVNQLDPVGEPFDPQFHQAMSMVENPDVEPNTVTLVMQKGYTINERLLRPAMVMVSKAVAGSVDENA